MFLLVDMYIKTRIAFIDRGLWTFDTKKMAREYWSGWFFLDLISSLPVDIFIWHYVDQNLLGASDQVDVTHLL